MSGIRLVYDVAVNFTAESEPIAAYEQLIPKLFNNRSDAIEQPIKQENCKKFAIEIGKVQRKR